MEIAMDGRHFSVFVLSCFLSAAATETHKNNVCATFGDYHYINDSPNCWYNPDVHADLPEMVARNGYPLETYEVTTDDGYILSLFRIPTKNESKAAVLLTPPLSANSGVWVDKGNRSLAFALSDANYDVWMGDFRGNTHSLRHLRLNPKQKEFWNFTLTEIANYDVQAMLEFAAKKSDRNDLTYVGHSMSSTIGLIYASIRPEDSARLVKVFVTMTMSVYYKHLIVPNMFIKLIKQLLEKLYDSGLYTIQNDATMNLIKVVCSSSALQLHLCVFSFIFGVGIKAEEIEPSWFPLLLARYPSGVAMKCYIHYLQLIERNVRFQYFDHGPSLNRYYYNQEVPPLYPLKDIKTPFYLMHGTYDLIVTQEDILYLYERLPSRAKIYGKRRVDIGHNDFVYGKNVKTQVNDRIVDFLDKTVYGIN